MAQDIFIDSNDDWELVDGTTFRLCESFEELTRQRVLINLRVFRGEWFANRNFGIQYFQSVYGKNTKNAVDAIFKNVIRRTEGVTKITNFNSSLDNETRKYTLTFSFLTEQGEITDAEVIV